jgi:hypothetical protein
MIGLKNGTCGVLSRSIQTLGFVPELQAGFAPVNSQVVRSTGGPLKVVFTFCSLGCTLNGVQAKIALAPLPWRCPVRTGAYC